MSPGARVPKNRIIGKTTVRHYRACLLGALLLLFSANARLARYDVQHRDLKLATAQSYLEGDDTRLELSIAALLLLWSVAVIAIPLLAANHEYCAVVSFPGSTHLGEFDPESHLRPPPVR